MAIVAAHGVYNNTITINETAVSGVNAFWIATINSLPSLTPAYTMPKTATTASLAAIPAAKLTDACQVPNPAGLNIGANRVPILPNKLVVCSCH